MRNTLNILGCGVLLLGLAACQSTETTVPISAANHRLEKVEAALQRWPTATTAGPALKRPFFATIHVGGRRTTASGIMQYYGPRDFRITAVTEMGAVLFDGRVNWAGVTVLRHMAGIDEGIVEQLLRDLSRAFELPPTLQGISTSGGGDLVLRKQLSDTHRYTWNFAANTGLLRSMDVELGLFDTLHINYLAYNAQGWPEEVQVVRKARLLDVTFTFTDNRMVQREWRGNVQ